MTIDELSARARLEVLHQCEDDFTGLWVVRRIVKRYWPGLPEHDLIDATDRVLVPLLESGQIIAGFPAGPYRDEKGFRVATRQWRLLEPSSGFLSSSLPIREVVERIRGEWAALDHEPTLGDVVWFVTTAHGGRVLSGSAD